ncbi:membrane-associated phospholipid phosphatase [Massilia sp.]|uniref:membrane-associated phospholipid phosphatase n=1 Tax=Massilia sp. TaxID=1882437 RepID=UPI0028AB2C30|nr:membrane-associated phospholipid phosphatase [Massilia sp.]
MIDIGHTAVALPLAAAIAAWLVMGRAWKMALYWCLMFVAGLSLVALSKIAFLGWDAGMESIGFKALSGHALCATAVMPVLFFVMLQNAPASWRRAGVLFGIWVSASLAVLLVHFKYHTASEVFASFILGSLISLGYIRIAMMSPAPRVSWWTIPLCIGAFVLLFILKPSSINHRLVDVALYLSGRDRPYQWTGKLICEAQVPLKR